MRQVRRRVRSSVGMVNPASTNCISCGGQSLIWKSPAGEYGVCVFPDGTACEEWALFHGECSKGQSSLEEMTCRLAGGVYYPDEKICELPDGSKVECPVDLPGNPYEEPQYAYHPEGSGWQPIECLEDLFIEGYETVGTTDSIPGSTGTWYLLKTPMSPFWYLVNVDASEEMHCWMQASETQPYVPGISSKPREGRNWPMLIGGAALGLAALAGIVWLSRK